MKEEKEAENLLYIYNKYKCWNKTKILIRV